MSHQRGGATGLKESQVETINYLFFKNRVAWHVSVAILSRGYTACFSSHAFSLSLHVRLRITMLCQDVRYSVKINEIMHGYQPRGS